MESKEKRLQYLEELEEAVFQFLHYEDTHKPGTYVKDGNWLPSVRNIYPKGFQICADEDCKMYWPCPVERLRRAYEGGDNDAST